MTDIEAKITRLNRQVTQLISGVEYSSREIKLNTLITTLKNMMYIHNESMREEVKEHGNRKELEKQIEDMYSSITIFLDSITKVIPNDKIIKSAHSERDYDEKEKYKTAKTVGPYGSNELQLRSMKSESGSIKLGSIKSGVESAEKNFEDEFSGEEVTSDEEVEFNGEHENCECANCIKEKKDNELNKK